MIQTWQFLVNEPREVASALTVLSLDEREQAERFHFERDRLRYVLAHAGLRRILSLCLGSKPESLQFSVSSHGKPFLTHDPALQFNLSHSGDYAFVGAGGEAPLGVDIECERETTYLEPTAKRVLTPVELEVFFAAPASRRLSAFTTYWTRKEAIMKATGLGIGLDPATFAVHSWDDRNPATLTLPDGSSWRLEDVPAPAGYRAALAVERSS